jgi:hypothetical protein
MAYVEFGLERPADYSLMFEGRALEKLDKPVAHATPFVDDLLEDLRQSSSKGDSYDLEHVLALWSALHGIVSLRNHKPSLPWQSWGADVERLVDSLTRFEKASIIAGSPPHSSRQQRA